MTQPNRMPLLAAILAMLGSFSCMAAEIKSVSEFLQSACNDKLFVVQGFAHSDRSRFWISDNPGSRGAVIFVIVPEHAEKRPGIKRFQQYVYRPSEFMDSTFKAYFSGKCVGGVDKYRRLVVTSITHIEIRPIRDAKSSKDL